ncbi:MAG: PAS domain S-box protein [Deltaproteobacteria bacterium]|nr:PAS domain S-box protein [Deltaproteobacteria bacterium]
MVTSPTCKELERRVTELEKKAAKRRSAEDALRESEKLLSQIVQGSLIPTIVIDAKHTITLCNKAYEELTGIAACDMLGTQKQWQTFYSKQRPIMADLIVDDAPEKEIARYYDGKYRKSEVIEGAYEAEDFFPDLGDKGKYLFFTAAPLRDAEGNIIGAIETLQDITERKHAEEALRKSERRLRSLFQFVPYPTVVLTLDGLVSYVNTAFTEAFGWSIEELEGKTIPYVPPELEQEANEKMRELLREKTLPNLETRRLTKDGRILDVVIRGTVYSETKGKPSGVLVILRDVTQEKRMHRINETLLHISMALPRYPNLEDLLDYISGEIKRALNVQGAIVILLDEERNELFFLGAAYDDEATERRAKEIRYSADKGISGRVIKTGEPLIIPDTSQDRDFYSIVDEQLGYTSRNMLDVPLRSGDRIIGVLCASNKNEGAFDQTDIELLNMIGGTVALSIENARVSKELKRAYEEVASLNRAKDKVINHLSHELKTPVAILSGSLHLLVRRLSDLPEKTWEPTIEMAQRNLDRIIDLQYEVEDIMQDKGYRAYGLLSFLLDQCTDELTTLIAEEVGEGAVVDRIKERIEDLFGPKAVEFKEIDLAEFIKERLETLGPLLSHREVEIHTHLAPAPFVYMPLEPLKKTIDGLVKNAIENTPDEGMLEIAMRKKGSGTEVSVHDYGVGIIDEDKKRIFEGFFTTMDTMDYSSKKPFDFNAGGKGADLLRMKIFSERYKFKIAMKSTRCGFIPKESDICPGRISQCSFCTKREDCLQSGETTFSIYFPPAPDHGTPKLKKESAASRKHTAS